MAAAARETSTSDGSIQAQRRALPIYPARGRLLKEIKANPCCIVVGETGSGKTSQIPQYLLEAHYAKKGMIAVTQPRRVAAVSIAHRVAVERGADLGKEVGYSIRFDDCTSTASKLKFMTDGILLREAILDPLLTRYSVVILDEAHERTIHTDMLFGVVKSAQTSRSHQQLHRLRIIIMSATLAAEEFAEYFNEAKILYIQGRQFPIKLYYTLSPQADYINSAVTTVLQIHGEEVQDGVSKGDVLVFLTGREEIESIHNILLKCQEMFPSDWLEMIVSPLFAALPSPQQQKIFQPTPRGCRKVILATNIAETSITISGVSYVIDTGVVKARGYNSCTGLDMLTVQPISKAQARQRMGRAGREGAGHCYRLYTQEYFEELREDTVPEIQRCHLSGVVLQLLALGISNVLSFDFMSQPPKDSFLGAVEQLYLLGAVKEKSQPLREENSAISLTKRTDESKESTERETEDYNLQLTPLGQTLAHFPLEPTLARAIITSPELGCSHEILSVVAMLSVDSVYFSPHDKRDKAASVQRKFISADGDHVTLLNMYRAYKSAKGNKAWCRDNFIHIRNMATVLNIRCQLLDLCESVGVACVSGGTECSQVLRKALLRGLFVNLAEHVGEGKYKTLSTGQVVLIHPSSCLFHIKPHPLYVMYSELVFTTKCYMRVVSIVESVWLKEICPSYHIRRIT